ncbi:hypothetical protein LTS18_008506 [Coniosporium uncinatum]|uniref:Uncharacterized protein n=1 Tax=Coniosporium uncinatum TaxID=93489 RepID=A0ACC3DAD5_9PEZI|nr:hypothetical protein LTS18_008506 [Coniosporium uncinatum]
MVRASIFTTFPFVSSITNVDAPPTFFLPPSPPLSGSTTGVELTTNTQVPLLQPPFSAKDSAADLYTSANLPPYTEAKPKPEPTDSKTLHTPQERLLVLQALLDQNETKLEQMLERLARLDDETRKMEALVVVSREQEKEERGCGNGCACKERVKARL